MLQCKYNKLVVRNASHIRTRFFSFSFFLHFMSDSRDKDVDNLAVPGESQHSTEQSQADRHDQEAHKVFTCWIGVVFFLF